MSKPDVNFTIGADGSAFAGALRKIQEPLNKIGQAFVGLQGIAAGLRTTFSAAMAPLQAYGELEDVKTQLGIMLNIEDAAERLASMVARLNDMGKAEFTELANAGGCGLYTGSEWG